jgi:hypothetical protein
MSMKSRILIISSLLIASCFQPATHAQLLRHPYLEDKQPIIKAVLEAELRRQNNAFEEITQLSSQNIGLLPVLEVSGRKIIVLDASKIGEQVTDGSSITYLLFKSFEAEGSKVAVRLSIVIEQDRCFGGYHKESRDYTYVASKVDDNWQAELKGRSVPLFDPKVSVKSF